VIRATSASRLSVGAITVLIGVAIVIAGCGGSDSPTKTPATQSVAASKSASPTQTAAGATTPASSGSGSFTDVCGLVSKQTVSDYLGANVVDKAATVPPVLEPLAQGVQAYTSSCAYSVSQSKYVTFTLWESHEPPEGIQGVAQSRCGGKEAISGLGDVACWSTADHLQITAAKDRFYLTVVSTASGGSGDALSTLVQEAVAQLP